MTRRQTAYWWAGALAALILFLWAFSDILTPFLFGALIAYFADPIAAKLESAGLSRIVATLAITGVAVLIGLLALVTVIPLLIDQLQRLIANAPDYLSRTQAMFDHVISRYVPAEGGLFAEDPGKLNEAAKNWSLRAIQGVLSGGLAFVDFLGVLLITPVVAFYLLLDWRRLLKTIDGWLPRDHADTIRRIASDVDNVLAGFLRGQLTVCLLLGSFYAIALTLAGLEFGLLVGIFAGLISFIPFLGSIVGLVLSVGLALTQFWGEWWWIALIAGIFVVGQLIEGNLLTPLLVGGNVGLHPVWLIFALSAFGFAFGFAGLLVAVPAAAVIGVLARWGIKAYQDSSLYRGSGHG